MSKVNRERMKDWAAQKIVELFEGLEDEVLINYVGAYLDQTEIDPEDMHISLNDMLERDAAHFMEELWTLLADAQHQPAGIPSALLAATQANVDARHQEHARISSGLRNAQYGFNAVQHHLPLSSDVPPQPPNSDYPNRYDTDRRDKEYRPRREHDRSANREAPYSEHHRSRGRYDRDNQQGDEERSAYRSEHRPRRSGYERGGDDDFGRRDRGPRDDRRGPRDGYRGRDEPRQDYRRRDDRDARGESDLDPFGRNVGRPAKPTSHGADSKVEDASP